MLHLLGLFLMCQCGRCTGLVLGAYGIFASTSIGCRQRLSEHYCQDHFRAFPVVSLLPICRSCLVVSPFILFSRHLSPQQFHFPCPNQILPTERRKMWPQELV
ncbi:hypothetical protein EDB19DRAFT_353771 [Suillus lakei]|nr:hypothetical protein EDB19DRAFT_353771 [Suillus lakei]